MTKAYTADRRIAKIARIGWVPINMMRIASAEDAQRTFRPAFCRHLAEHFDPEKIGLLVVSKRDGYYWIIDGQHRKAAMEAIGWGDQQVQCEIYEGLTVAEEAEMFLGRNDNLGITQYTKFKVGVKAGRTEEIAIDGIVRSCGLRVSNTKAMGSVAAVVTLRNVYRSLGADTLRRTLTLVYTAYGQHGLDAPVIHGIALVLHRYTDLKDSWALEQLATAPGSINSLITKAAVLSRTLEQPKHVAVAAAAVEIINRPRPGTKRGGRKLPDWFAAAASDAADEVA